MAVRAAERAARRKAEEPPEPDMPPGHEGHHSHVPFGYNFTVCSCGVADGGCWSFVPDSRCWSEDPAVRAQLAREEADFEAWLTCRICGQEGVMAAEDFGIWPPRTLEVPPR